MTTKTPPHLLTILAKLNQIGTAINQSKPDNLTDLAETLNLIVETATEVVPGSSAVIYTYNETDGNFDISSDRKSVV